MTKGKTQIAHASPKDPWSKLWNSADALRWAMTACAALGAALFVFGHAVLGVAAVAVYTVGSIRRNELGDSPLSSDQNRVMDANIQQGAVGRLLGPRGARFVVLFPFHSIIWAGFAYLVRTLSQL
ncbi:hypothetical protein [Paraburkholderia youngii]|uniref:hypothetical protein n=1 Tax=Paraburkholderia youngii TaxID=2782701 RepID=UPI003D22C034